MKKREIADGETQGRSREVMRGTFPIVSKL